MSACTAVASRSLCEFSFSRRANAFERQRLLIVVTPRRSSADARRVLTTQLDQPRLSNPLRNRASMALEAREEIRVIWRLLQAIQNQEKLSEAIRVPAQLSHRSTPA